MVMYVDLLTRALGTDEAGSRSNDLLLADLVDSRVRLRGVNGGSTSSAAESLARELFYTVPSSFASVKPLAVPP